MSEQDREKWDRRYSDDGAAPAVPSQLMMEQANLLPVQGRALDIGGGAGRNAIWLSQRGLNVTLADISPKGLAIATRRAAAVGIALKTECIDVERSSPTVGAWDLITCLYFLHRPLFAVFPEILSAGGTLLVIHPTRTNLERHEKPPARFLLEDGELPQLVQGLKIAHYEEGWLAEGRHEAVVVARKTGGAN